MLDIKLIREDKENIEEKLRRKEPETDLDPILKLDVDLRNSITRVEELKQEKNSASKQIGVLKREGKDASKILEEVASFGAEIDTLDAKINELREELTHKLAQIPNIPFDNIPISQNIEDNKIIKEWKEKPTFDFTPKNHMELNEKLNLFDFTRGAKLSGKGWPVYRGIGARLEWALLNYMIETHIKNGFEQIMAPLAVRPKALFGSGQLPKFGDQVFKFDDEDYPFYLVPTAEVSLNGLYLDEIISAEELPIKMTSYSPCFRREAGAAGSQERGLIRVHQFNKVEMFCITKPDESQKIFETMLSSAEEILEGLELHYRNALLCTGDMSFPSSCTIDVEAWLPGQDRYYEVSSISNCTDYQARRSQMRYRPEANAKPEFVHTLNGSGLATSRLMVSLLECNQNKDGSVRIPKVLQSRLGGLEVIEPTS